MWVSRHFGILFRYECLLMINLISLSLHQCDWDWQAIKSEAQFPLSLGNWINWVSPEHVGRAVPDATSLTVHYSIGIIDLRQNRLSGNIPEDLSKMKKISTIHLDGNNLEGVIPDKVCSLFDRTFPEFSADCSEFDDECPCCTTCCVENQCSCRYEGTPQEYLCYSRTAGSEP